MLIDEKTFRESFRIMVRGILIVIVLSLFKSITEYLPGGDYVLGKFRFSTYITMLLNIAIVGMLIRMYSSVTTVVTFYLSAFVKVGKIPGRDKLMDHIIAISNHIVLLIYLIVLYEYLTPMIVDINNAYLDWRKLKMVIDIGSVLFGVYILVMLWKDGQPVVEIITGGITDKVTGATAKVAYAACPKCGSNNDPDAEFCGSCGTKMSSVSSVQSNMVNCSKCGTANPATSKFCQKCGNQVA
jgi:ribosomal protein L40E